MGIQTITLLGPDFPTLGEIHIEALGPHIALGISAGRFPKAYPHAEPNEDAAMAATNGIDHLLAVADGHNGSGAATGVITALAASAAQILAADNPGVMVRQVAEEALNGIGSGTTLTAVALTPASTIIASAGDSAALDLSGRPRWLTAPTPFLSAANPLQATTTSHVSRLALLTDGVSDFLGRSPAKAIRALWTGQPSDDARAIIELSHAGAAGDNTTVITFERSPR